MKTVLENAPLVLQHPDDYNPRAELMWSSTIAHNGILNTGRTGDWGSHKLAHELSTMYGLAHGATLSIIFPAWMKYVYKKRLDNFYKFAVRVFDVDPCFGSTEYVARKGIDRLIAFYRSLDLPTTLEEADIDDSGFEEMAGNVVIFGQVGRFVKLDKKDVLAIYDLAR
jgi:alcohol dehydrogenase YqhD (iron-dependent ADH family)